MTTPAGSFVPRTSLQNVILGLHQRDSITWSELVSLQDGVRYSTEQVYAEVSLMGAELIVKHVLPHALWDVAAESLSQDVLKYFLIRSDTTVEARTLIVTAWGNLVTETCQGKENPSNYFLNNLAPAILMKLYSCVLREDCPLSVVGTFWRILDTLTNSGNNHLLGRLARGRSNFPTVLKAQAVLLGESVPGLEEELRQFDPDLADLPTNMLLEVVGYSEVPADWFRNVSAVPEPVLRTAPLNGK